MMALVGLVWPQAALAKGQSCTEDSGCTLPWTCGSTYNLIYPPAHPDAGPVCMNGPKTCTWRLLPCQTNSECTQPQWACIHYPGGAGKNSICFPQDIDCSTGQACPANWSCVNVLDAMASDMYQMWKFSNEDRICWPDNLSAVVEGSIEVDFTFLDHTGDPCAQATAKADAGAPPIADAATSGPTTVDARLSKDVATSTIGSPKADTGTAATPSSSSLGCSMLGSSGRAGTCWTLALVLVALRRRR